MSGNPVRPEFFEAEGRMTNTVRRQGRLGSWSLAALRARTRSTWPWWRQRRGWLPPPQRLAITHQTGERDLEMVRDGYRRAGLEARVEPFLFAMDREMKSADVVVCRAGATTLAELTAAGRPSILIPLPTATDDHQRKNAEALVQQGAARMIEQRELTGDRLAAEILGAGRRSRRAGAR